MSARSPPASVAPSELCRCSKGNEMNCPGAAPLGKIVNRLKREGYEPYVHVVDARWAKSLLVACTNCGSRGRFDCVGYRKERRGEVTVRAFWICRRCRHWREV